MPDMELNDFGKYLHGKSVAKLLHRARMESIKRITADTEDLEKNAATNAAAWLRAELLQMALLSPISPDSASGTFVGRFPTP